MSSQIIFSFAFWMRDNSRQVLLLKDGSVPIAHDLAAPPGVVSVTLYIYFLMIICESPLLFHGKERGWVSRAHYHVKRYAPKWVAVNWQGKRVVLHDHWDHFEKTLKNHTILWKIGIRCPIWSTATAKSHLIYNKSEIKYRFKIITGNSLIAKILFLKSNICIAMTRNTRI